LARGRPTNPARIPVGPAGRWYQISAMNQFRYGLTIHSRSIACIF